MSSSMPMQPEDPFGFQHGIRHIASIQIRNLTPSVIHDLTSTNPDASTTSTPDNGTNSGFVTILRRRVRDRSMSTSSLRSTRTARPGDTLSVIEGWREEVAGVKGSANDSASLCEDPFTESEFSSLSHKTTELFITINVPSPRHMALSHVGSLKSSRHHSTFGSRSSIHSRNASRPPEGLSSSREKVGSSPLKSSISLPSPTSARTRHIPSAGTQTNGLRHPKHLSSSSNFRRSSVSPSSIRVPQTNSLEAPAYLSRPQRIHTNSLLDIDVNVQEFADWADPNGTDVTVELCAYTSKERIEDLQGLAAEFNSVEEQEECKVLRRWHFDLSELVPLPDDMSTLDSPQSGLNLLLELLPTGQLYHLPTKKAITAPAMPRHVLTEDDVNNVSDEDETASDIDETLATESSTPHGGRESLIRYGKRRDMKSAGWGDLVKLASLQAVVYDTRQSLFDIKYNIDGILSSNETGHLRRELSLRQCKEEDVRRELAALRTRNDATRNEIANRRAIIKERYDTLAQASILHKDHLRADFETTQQVAVEKNSYQQLVERIMIRRTSLLSTLSFIFPIELSSASELLFTILSVPLPIPMKGPDPAPRLFNAGHREITEDTIASALGYAAHVVQLLAAYYGQYLVYPVTYIASRSLISDKISNMKGPRVFPLYSKGVENYRFEYAVFLLNKNIEIVMAEQNLRTTDMRHTLPNLKNLLLTLIDRNGRISKKAAPSISGSFDSALAAQ